MKAACRLDHFPRNAFAHHFVPRQQPGANPNCGETFTKTRRMYQPLPGLHVNGELTQGEKRQLRERAMNGLIYLVGLIVVILFILSALGLR